MASFIKLCKIILFIAFTLLLEQGKDWLWRSIFYLTFFTAHQISTLLFFY